MLKHMKKIASRIRNEKQGMSLLELMMAAGILSLTFVMVGGSIISIANATRANDTKTSSVAYVGTIMEDIHDMNLDDLMNYVPPELDTMGDDYEVEVAIMKGDEERMELPLDLYSSETGEAREMPDLPDNFEINILVYWRDDTGRVYTTEGSMIYGS
jgi:hypothetical protein